MITTGDRVKLLVQPKTSGTLSGRIGTVRHIHQAGLLMVWFDGLQEPYNPWYLRPDALEKVDEARSPILSFLDADER